MHGSWTDNHPSSRQIPEAVATIQQAIGDHDTRLESPVLEVLEKPQHVVLVIGHHQGKSHRQVTQWLGRQKQGEAAQVQFVHAESAAEMLQNPSDARTRRVAWFDRGARRRRTRWRDRARTQRQSWVHPCPCLRPFLLRAGNLIHEDASPDFQAQNELLMPPSLAEITEESPFSCSRRDALRQHPRRLIGACRWKCSNSSQGSNLTICETDTFGIVPKSAVGHGVRTRRFAAQGEHQSALFCQAFLGGGPHVGSSGHY
jgi:hypothetical protein